MNNFAADFLLVVLLPSSSQVPFAEIWSINEITEIWLHGIGHHIETSSTIIYVDMSFFFLSTPKLHCVISFLHLVYLFSCLAPETHWADGLFLTATCPETRYLKCSAILQRLKCIILRDSSHIRGRAQHSVLVVLHLHPHISRCLRVLASRPHENED